MNNDLQKKLSSLENMMRIQQDCLEQGYMHGMMNGLICAHSVIAECNPDFIEMPRRKVKVRHKARKLPNRRNL